MRGALSGIGGWRQDKQTPRGRAISIRREKQRPLPCADVADPVAVFGGFSLNFLLFCLTGAAIFDNRHGLLKKFDSARAAKPLSPPLKPHE